MYRFFSDNALYLVLVIALLVWSGIYWYLTKIDKKVEQLEQTMNTTSEGS